VKSERSCIPPHFEEKPQLPFSFVVDYFGCMPPHFGGGFTAPKNGLKWIMRCIPPHFEGDSQHAFCQTLHVQAVYHLISRGIHSLRRYIMENTKLYTTSFRGGITA